MDEQVVFIQLYSTVSTTLTFWNGCYRKLILYNVAINLMEMLTNCPHVTIAGVEAGCESPSLYEDLFDILNDDIIELGPSQGTVTKFILSFKWAIEDDRLLLTFINIMWSRILQT